MSYVMSPVQYTLEDDSNCAAFADLQVGSNGDSEGDPTTFIGDTYGDEAWTYNLWDENVSTGFDTGNVPVSFDAKSDGTETLAVMGSDALSYQTDTLGVISSVEIIAAVQTNAQANWSNLNVEFLQNGSITEVDNIASGPAVDTTNSGSNSLAEQILTVRPTMPNADEVIVSGGMRMRSPSISYPAADGMFCEIVINGANATSSGSSGGFGIGPGSPDHGNG